MGSRYTAMKVSHSVVPIHVIGPKVCSNIPIFVIKFAEYFGDTDDQVYFQIILASFRNIYAVSLNATCLKGLASECCCLFRNRKPALHISRTTSIHVVLASK